MAKTIPFAKKGPYYYRFRSLPVALTGEDGTTKISADCIDCLTTRWGYQRSRYRRPTDAYYSAEFHLWFTIRSISTATADDGTPTGYRHCFVPMQDGTLCDRYPSSTMDRGDVPFCNVKIKGARTAQVVQLDSNGKALAVIGTADDGDGWNEQLLGLLKTKRKSPRKAA